MSAHPITVIASDIGGVIRNMVNDEPIENSIESITKLAENRLQMQEEVKAKGEKLAKMRAEGK